MKTLFTAALLSLSVAAHAFEAGRPDTILVKLKKADKLIIVTPPGSVGLKGFSEYDVNRILAKVDSTLQANRTTVSRVSGGDTTLVIQRVETSRATASEGDKDHRDITISFSSKSGGPKIVIKDRMVEEEVSISARDEKKKRSRLHYNSFTMNLGLTNYLTSSGKAPSGADAGYALNAASSRYITLGWKWYQQLGHSPFGINYGAEFAWQNFMLKDGYQFTSTDSGTQLVDLRNTANLSVTKSKLVQSSIKVPVALETHFGKGWVLELGGFAGLRIGSHAKLKYEQDGNTKKDFAYGSFDLTDFHYGARAVVRHRGFGIFGEYQANTLFASGKGPELHAMQFGVCFGGI